MNENLQIEHFIDLLVVEAKDSFKYYQRRPLTEQARLITLACYIVVVWDCYIFTAFKCI